ncbi:MAG: hypothetical protein AB7F35_01000 [Acetobacteraceae bacterium]
MNETLGTHSEMLAVIMEAATKEVSSDLGDTLKAILLTLRTQSDQLVMIGRLLSRIDQQLAEDG